MTTTRIVVPVSANLSSGDYVEPTLLSMDELKERESKLVDELEITLVYERRRSIRSELRDLRKRITEAQTREGSSPLVEESSSRFDSLLTRRNDTGTYERTQAKPEGDFCPPASTSVDADVFMSSAAGDSRLPVTGGITQSSVLKEPAERAKAEKAAERPPSRSQARSGVAAASTSSVGGGGITSVSGTNVIGESDARKTMLGSATHAHHKNNGLSSVREAKVDAGDPISATRNAVEDRAVGVTAAPLSQERRPFDGLLQYSEPSLSNCEQVLDVPPEQSKGCSSEAQAPVPGADENSLDALSSAHPSVIPSTIEPRTNMVISPQNKDSNGARAPGRRLSNLLERFETNGQNGSEAGERRMASRSMSERRRVGSTQSSSSTSSCQPETRVTTRPSSTVITDSRSSVSDRLQRMSLGDNVSSFGLPKTPMDKDPSQVGKNNRFSFSNYADQPSSPILAPSSKTEPEKVAPTFAEPRGLNRREFSQGTSGKVDESVLSRPSVFSTKSPTVEATYSTLSRSESNGFQSTSNKQPEKPSAQTSRPLSVNFSSSSQVSSQSSPRQLNSPVFKSPEPLLVKTEADIKPVRVVPSVTGGAAVTAAAPAAAPDAVKSSAPASKPAPLTGVAVTSAKPVQSETQSPPASVASPVSPTTPVTPSTPTSPTNSEKPKSSSAPCMKKREDRKPIKRQMSISSIVLDWVKEMVRDYGVEVRNFSSSWNNGMAFCALIHRFHPDAFDYSSLRPENKEHNFKLAFETAHNLKKIPMLLDVEDMVKMEMPEPRSVQCYVQWIWSVYGPTSGYGPSQEELKTAEIA